MTKSTQNQPDSASKANLAGFFILTYLISWGVLIPEIFDLPFDLPTPLLILVGFGPAFAALILAAKEGGWQGVSALLGRLKIARISWGWYVTVLFGPFILFFAALGIGALLGIEIDLSEPAILNTIPMENGNVLILVIPAFIYLFVTLLGEEIGWRGYALPRMLSNQSELAASVLLGLLWGVWHLPMAFAPSLQAAISSLSKGWFMVDIIAMSIIFTWIFVNTQGSLLIAVLLHTSNNLGALFLPILPPAVSDTRIFLVLIVLKWLLALAILAAHGSKGWKSFSEKVQVQQS